MTNNAFISIRDVSKKFGKVEAVNGISIDVAKGEFFSLLGPSGCGKTTLLRMLAGFEFPTSGEIFIDDQPMSSVAPNKRPVNMVFQNYAIFPHLNVKQNIAYSLSQDKLTKSEVSTKVGEMLDLIGLPGYENRASHELSGGERQRVALARALIRRPKVLLLDEPLGALDKKLREKMQLELRALQKSVGITFIFVTHDQEEALTMSDRVAVMSNGRCLQVDAPSQLYEEPQSREVADFIGTMNFIEVDVQGVDADRIDVVSGAIGNFSVLRGSCDATVGDKMLLAIRPEKISVSSTKPKTGICWQGDIDETAYLGDRSFLYFRVTGLEEPIIVAAQNSTKTEGFSGQLSSSYWLSWSDLDVTLLRAE